MAAISEDYVSFETAKLLKEKGFPQSTFVCNTVYKPNGYISNNAKSFMSPSYIFKDIYIFAPTLQMAMKWLREAHKIHIAFYPYGKYSCDNYQFDVYKDNNMVMSKDDGYATYEQACEAAIKYCLEKLI